MDSSQQQLERIVAYLDGELGAEESAQVEQQLAADEQFRQQLQGAERAWSALDELPMAQVGDEFSRTTMEMVVDAAHQDIEAKTIALPIQQRKKKTTTAILAAMTVLLGALAFRVLANTPNRKLLADLPVIQHVDIYSQIKEVDFLRELERGLGDRLESSTLESEQLADSVAEFQLVSATSNRSSWLESLPTEEQISLRAKFNRFRNLLPQQQAELRQLHQQIDSAADREQLLQTMFRYQHWLKELPPSVRYEYRSLAGAERMDRVAGDMERMAKEQELELTDDQIREIFIRLKPQIEEILDQNKPAIREFYSRRSPPERQEFRSLTKPEQMRRVLLFSMTRSPEQMRRMVDTITGALPNDVEAAFERLGPREKKDRIQAWIRQFHSSAREVGRMGRISEQELANFFVELEPEDKERLLALPSEDMHEQLERMYRGKMWQGGRRGPGEMRHRRPSEGPPDGRRRERFEDRRGPGPGPPRGGRRFEEDQDGLPPRVTGRTDPRRRRPQEGPPPGER